MGVISELAGDIERTALRLMAEHYGRLCLEAKKLCCCETDVEDLVALTLEAAFRNIQSFEHRSDVFTWMCSILRNTHAKQFRRIVNRKTTPVDAETLENLAGVDNNTVETLIKNSDADVLREAIGRLDPEYKRVLVMHYFAELPVKNIALALNMPVGTVLWRLNVARKLLAKDLGEKLGKIKKPLAALGAVLFGFGLLWGAAVSPLGDWVRERAASSEAQMQISTNKEGIGRMNFTAARTGLIAATAALATSACAQPADCTLVEYLESTAGGGQYVDTGYKPTTSTRIVADLNPLAKTENWLAFLGVTKNDSSADGILLRYYGSGSDNINGWFCNSMYEQAQISGLANTRFTAELQAGGMKIGETTATISTTGKPYDGSIFVFCGNNGGTAWRHQAMRLYSLRIYEGDVLVRDLRPCVKNGLGCLYNQAYDAQNPATGLEYYENRGGGCFAVGPALASILQVTGSPKEFGEVSPSYGWTYGLSAGDAIPCSATADWTNETEGVALEYCGYVVLTNDVVCTRGTDSRFTYEHPECATGAHLVWQWRRHYRVTVSVPGGGGTVACSHAWLPEDEEATLTATAAAGKVFVRWEGDVPAESGAANPLKLTADSAKSVQAVFADLSSVTWRWTGAGADGLASNPENWLNGDGGKSVPTAGARIVFGSDGSDRPCKWDLNVPLASWHQEGYESTVTIATRYTASSADKFVNLVIGGNAEVMSGTWTSLANYNTPDANNSSVFRLRVSVGGDLTVGPDAVIHADACGYGNSWSPACRITGSNGGTYGGPGGRLTGENYDNTYVNDPMYGSITEPTHLGSGGNFGIGGGAIYMTVAGHTTLNGQLRSTDDNNSYYPGSGGSIYLRTGTLSGSGKISADSHSTRASGSGGRIAIKLTAPGADFSAFDVVNQVSAVCPSTGGNRGASGTIYAEKPGDEPDHGWLIMKGYGAPPPTNARAMRITYASGQVCDFARITMTNAAIAVFNVGETLVMTNTVLEIADEYGVTNGFWFNGGKLSADPTVPYELPCDVVVYGKQPFTDAAMPAVVVPGGRTLTFDGSVSTQTCSIVNLGSVVLRNQSSVSLTSDWTNEGTATMSDDSRVHFVGADMSTITGDTTFPNLICQEPGKMLAIAAGTTLTVPYTLVLSGERDDCVTLKRASGDANWNLNVGADAFVQLQYLAVDHSTAMGVPLTAYLSDDAGGNVNWTFDDSGLKNVWTGMTSSDFSDPANWSNGEVPGPGDALEVLVDSPMVVKTDICFGSVLIGGKADVTFQNKVDVTGDLVVTNTAKLTYLNPGVIGGSAFVGSGAMITHKGNESSETYRLELDVGGDFTIEAGGSIDVTEKGYSGNSKGPGAATGGFGSSYGGRGSGTSPTCYGSVLCPTNCGSSGSWGGIGGGLVILRIAGNLTLDGEIRANGGRNPNMGAHYDGTGGGVWVTAAGIRGAATGSIQARAGACLESSGGRIAVHLTGKGNDFSSYHGAFDAFNTGWQGGCGTVYLQTGDEEFGKGRVVIANNGCRNAPTELPSLRVCNPKELDRRVRVEVGNGGVFGLSRDLKVDDLTMDDDCTLNLNGHTLFIYHRRHALGKSASQIVPGGTEENPGRIVWINGLIITVR